MPKDKSSDENGILQFLLELLLIAIQAMAQAAVRYFIVVSFILLSLGGYILTDKYYVWGVFLLAVYGLWKIFDLIDDKTEGLLKRF